MGNSDVVKLFIYQDFKM